MRNRSLVVAGVLSLVAPTVLVLAARVASIETVAASWRTARAASSQEAKPPAENSKAIDAALSIPPGKEDLPAEQVFKNIEILKGKPASRLPGMMKALNGLLGVECTYCHLQGAWDKEEPAAKVTSRRMFKMVGKVTHAYFEDQNKVTCWTCHHGTPKPSNGGEKIAAGMANLPDSRRQIVAALTEKLGENKNKPAGEVFENIRMFKDMQAQHLLSLMGVLTVVLDVDCSHCHVPNAWAKDDKTPKQTARKMFQMLPDINRQLFDGPPKAACWTCHRGSTKPESLPPAPS